MDLKHFLIALIIVGAIAAIVNFAVPDNIYKRIGLIVLGVFMAIIVINFLWPLTGL